MIKAVTFDFWETLVRDSPEKLREQRALRIQALHRVLAGAGSGIGEVEVAEAYDRSERVLVERFWSRHRDPSIAQQVRLVLETVSPGVARAMTPALFEEALAGYIEPVLHVPPELTPRAAEAVRELASRGVVLGIISNTGRTPGVILRRVLERHDLLRHFTAVSYSDEVGYRKPDAEIFRRRPAGPMHALQPESRASYAVAGPLPGVADQFDGRGWHPPGPVPRIGRHQPLDAPRIPLARVCQGGGSRPSYGWPG